MNKTAQMKEKTESDNILEFVKKASKQTKLVLYAMLKQKNKYMFTQEVYKTYKRLSKKYEMKTISEGEMLNITAQLDRLGLIWTKLVKQGRVMMIRVRVRIPKSKMKTVTGLLKTETSKTSKKEAG